MENEKQRLSGKDYESEKNISKYAEKGGRGECDAVYPKYM